MLYKSINDKQLLVHSNLFGPSEPGNRAGSSFGLTVFNGGSPVPGLPFGWQLNRLNVNNK
jgi:hypothetical protein